MQKIFIPALNTLTLVLTIFFNYWAAYGYFNDVSVESIDRTYKCLYFPDNYVHTIWALVYLGMIALLIFQWRETIAGKNGGEITGIWMTITNVANSLWIYSWSSQLPGLSILFMFFLLMSLLVQAMLFNMECWDAPVRIILFVWWPIGTYLGLVIFTMFGVVIAFLERWGWTGGPLGEELWAVILLSLTTVVYIMLVFTRNMRETALVGAWMIFGTVVRHWFDHPAVAYASLIMVALILTVVVWHGYKNRAGSVFAKIKGGDF